MPISIHLKVYESGKLKLSRLFRSEQVRIGTGSCDLVLEGTGVAPNHAVIDAGSKLGPALGVLLGVKMINWLSWRYMFAAIGFASLLWLIPWCFLVPRLASRKQAAFVGWTRYCSTRITGRRTRAGGRNS